MNLTLLLWRQPIPKVVKTNLVELIRPQGWRAAPIFPSTFLCR